MNVYERHLHDRIALLERAVSMQMAENDQLAQSRRAWAQAATELDAELDDERANVRALQATVADLQAVIRQMAREELLPVIHGASLDERMGP